MKFNVSASITDFPLQTSIETFFKKFKESGIDGVEIVLGCKTFNLPQLFQLSGKYNLPITSFHQSPWSGFGFSIDDFFIRLAERQGVTTFTFHPLAFMKFDTSQMKAYFLKLSQLQKKYGVTICLENMRDDYFYHRLYSPPYTAMSNQLQKMYTIAKEYDLSITYDVSHALLSHPQKNETFLKLYPWIQNIHISSFKDDEEHLPLDKGDFDARAFIQFLYKQKYKGLLTFEINYSLKKRVFTPYDFFEVKRSVDIIRSVSDKSS